MANLTKSEEDYLESIYVIQQEKKVVRIKDIAKHLNIKLPSVTEAVKKLSQKSLTIYERYGYVQLTSKGKKHAQEVFKKHQAVFTFLTKILRVKKETALKDACLIEHNLSAETLEKLIKFIEKNN
ncbi:MAG: metal-dependent transcriptional regulator [Nanoarchaeota archaeon]|nr:metal-dependent transcriptional regulator [Nanoarchaeota archaeon]